MNECIFPIYQWQCSYNGTYSVVFPRELFWGGKPNFISKLNFQPRDMGLNVLELVMLV